MKRLQMIAANPVLANTPGLQNSIPQLMNMASFISIRDAAVVLNYASHMASMSLRK